jgi:hypothetical protein
MRTANYLLGSGLACLVLGCGLGQFVIIGLLGILLAGVALGLLLAGGVVARSADVSRRRAAGGMAVIVAGVIALLWVAGEVCMLAQDNLRSQQVGLGPVPDSRLAVLGLIPIPGLILAAGLRLRSGWPWVQCVGWGIATALAVVAAAGVFYVLAGIGAPMDA